MPPSISRRRLLLGGSAVLGTAAAGAAVAPASALPDPIATARATLRPVPEMSTRPPVTDGHVQDALSSVDDLIERAEATWNRVDDQEGAVENLPGLADPDRAIDEARDYRRDAGNEAGWDALFSLRQAAAAAGRAIGGARLALGEASGEHLAEQARDIQGSVADTRETIEYRVADPSTGLARLYWVEKWLSLAHLNSYRDGTYAGQDEPTTEYDDRSIIETWSEHMSARRTHADAERLYADYRDGLEDTRSLTEHVERVERAIRESARDRKFGSDGFDRLTAEIEELPEGPYQTYMWQVFYYAQNTSIRDDEGPWAGLPVYRTVKNAIVLLSHAAWDDARGRAPIDPGTNRIDGSVLAATKERGLELLRQRRREAADRPLLELLVEEGRRLLWAGDTDLERDSDVDHPRARALANYRLGVGYLRQVEGVTARIDQPDA